MDQSLVTSAATKLAVAALVLIAIELGWWLVQQSGKTTKQPPGFFFNVEVSRAHHVAGSETAR